MTVNIKTTILGQAYTQKFVWLPSITIQFKTIDARWFFLNANWFVHRLVPALEYVEVNGNQ